MNEKSSESPRSYNHPHDSRRRRVKASKRATGQDSTGSVTTATSGQRQSYQHKNDIHNRLLGSPPNNDETSSEGSVRNNAAASPAQRTRSADPSPTAPRLETLNLRSGTPGERGLHAERRRKSPPITNGSVSRRRTGRKKPASQGLRKTPGLLPKSTSLLDEKVLRDVEPKKPPAATIWPSQTPRRSENPAEVTTTGICLQPETHPITEEQLVNEVRGIYAGLVMVEKKCIEIDKQQSESKEELTDAQWQALIALHRTLLHEHHDFFLASNHPAASPVLKKLAERYAMPARMWRYGIHSFLELLRHRLPGSLDHMLTFIYIAYSMKTLLLESVPSFEETWIECLGDLARYRMAVEESDMRDREVWSGVARYWYNKAADKNPGIGRIQHHLAVLARPNILQQLFYYSKSLVSMQPFLSTRDSILLLFNPLLDPTKPVNNRYPPLLTAFVSSHGILFTRQRISSFAISAQQFLSNLDRYVGRIGAVFREQGVYIMSSNYAAIFDFGQADSQLLPLFDQKVIQENLPSERLISAQRYWQDQASVDQSILSQRHRPRVENNQLSSSSQVISFASHLAFSTLSIILERVGDKNVLPSVHLSLAFLWSTALVLKSMAYIEVDVPWVRIASFLNTLIRPETNMSRAEDDKFPSYETGPSRQLPEDFLIRGQAFSQLYYPEGFFDVMADDEERSIELPSVIVPRTDRCLWLGTRIASFNRWITYDPAQRSFSPKPFAYELENLAHEHNPLDSPSPATADPIQLSVENDKDTPMSGT